MRSPWDYRNRLTQVVVKDSSNNILQQSDYTYDAFDRRIIKSFDDDGPGPHSATVTKTLYDAVQPPSADQIAKGTTALQPDGSYASAIFAANPYADFNGSNALTMRYLYGPAVDMIIARRDVSGTVAWYLTDHLGTVRDLASTSGTVLDHISYSAFGRVTAETSTTNGDRFTFSGRESDPEVGMYYFRARYLSPSAGRFVSEDPLRFDALDTNLVRYLGNSPVTATDPLGMIDITYSVCLSMGWVPVLPVPLVICFAWSFPIIGWGWWPPGPILGPMSWGYVGVGVAGGGKPGYGGGISFGPTTVLPPLPPPGGNLAAVGIFIAAFKKFGPVPVAWGGDIFVPVAQVTPAGVLLPPPPGTPPVIAGTGPAGPPGIAVTIGVFF